MANPRLKIRLTPAAEQAARSGHPWIFADRLKSINRPGECGELAVIYDRNDRFFGAGLYDPHSPIRLRMLHVGSPLTIDESWWIERFRSALKKREGLFGPETNSYRLINGESDGLPGLVLDRYADTCVLKIYTTIWLPWLEDICRWISTTVSPVPTTIVLRLSRNIQSHAENHFSRQDGSLLHGALKNPIVLFSENGKHFEADVIKGQKTGFFLDQRENRHRVSQMAKGCDVLNLFSHSGGFSVYAAVAGAKSTTDVDISTHALDEARRNMALNPAGRSCQHHRVKADAFDWLNGHDGRYDLIIIDPPSLARRAAEKPAAINSYTRLMCSSLKLLRPKGLLVAASCTAHIPSEEFFEIARQVVNRSGRRIKTIETHLHAPDHQANIPEAHYLKAIYFRMAN